MGYSPWGHMTCMLTPYDGATKSFSSFVMYKLSIGHSSCFWVLYSVILGTHFISLGTSQDPALQDHP